MSTNGSSGTDLLVDDKSANVDGDGRGDHRSDSNVSEADESDESVFDPPATGDEPREENRRLDGFELDDPDIETLVAFEPAIEASLGEFGTADDLERAYSTMTAEVVIGHDDRIRIDASDRYPWRAICSLRIHAKDGTNWIGTGFFVGPRVVVTAGHVVHMSNHGGWAEEIEVIPGRDGAKQPYGSCTSRHFHSVTGWTRKRDRNHDYGAIVLPHDCRFGDRVGWFGYANLGDGSLQNLDVNLSGYPGDKGGSTQWWHARRITRVTGEMLRYNIDTAGGQSGAPVWRLRNGQRHVVGIHTTGSQSGNGATRINRDVFDRIKGWKALHP